MFHDYIVPIRNSEPINMQKNASIKHKNLENQDYFKVCTYCGFVWQDRESFLNDDDLKIIGYQTHFKELNTGLFLFNHSCNGTISIKVKHFVDLYDGPIFKEKKLYTEECPEHCLYTNSLDSCRVQCECAFVRDIIQRIKKTDPFEKLEK